MQAAAGKAAAKQADAFLEPLLTYVDDDSEDGASDVRSRLSVAAAPVTASPAERLKGAAGECPVSPRSAARTAAAGRGRQATDSRAASGTGARIGLLQSLPRPPVDCDVGLSRPSSRQLVDLCVGPDGGRRWNCVL